MAPLGEKASRGDRILLAAEVLVCALPSYLIYLACLPWALLAVGIIPSAIDELISRDWSFAHDDVGGILPYLILGLTACLGVLPLWRGARLMFRVLAGSSVGARESIMLAKTVRLALIPLGIMVLTAIGNAIPSLSHGSSWAIRTWPEAVFGLYLSGLPLLVPAIHLHRIFAAHSSTDCGQPSGPQETRA